jgi:hypothetical protein
MAQLTLEMFNSLRDGIRTSFSTKASLEPVAFAARDRSLDYLALGNSLEDIIDRLIRRADEEAWLGELLRALCNARPDSAELKAFRSAWQADALAAVGAAVDHFKVLMLPGRRALINRQALRDSLASLVRPNGARVLAVDGDDESGKSYSVQYVGYLCEALANFQFFTVDLERVRRNANNKVDAQTIGEAISDALVGRIYDPPKDNNLTTWIDGYCNRLGRELPAHQVRWLVIDSFRKVGVEQNAYDLIAALAMRTYRELFTLRLVLLSYRDVEWLKARVVGDVQYEWIAAIDNRHLAAFFGELWIERHRRTGKPLDTAAVAPQISAAITRVLAKAAGAEARRLEVIGRSAWDEALTILAPAQPAGNPLLDELVARSLLAGGGAAGGGAANPGGGS